VIQVGDQVQMLRDSQLGVWCENGAGAKGSIGEVTRIDSLGDLLVNFADTTWWVRRAEVHQISTQHTDADLAMALELADLIRADFSPSECQLLCQEIQADYSSIYIYTWDWLRTEVRNALLER